jgi:hypothetical protein
MKHMALFWFVCLSCLGTVRSFAEDGSDKVQGILSDDVAVRAKAREEFKAERADVISVLQKILRTDKSKKADDLLSSTKHLAIELAGQLRVEQCTDDLFKELDFEMEITSGGYASRLGVENRFPTTKSLIQIGTYTVVIKSLEMLTKSEASDHSKEMCAIILRGIVGRKKAEELVLGEIAKTNDELRRASLSDALKRLRSMSE